MNDLVANEVAIWGWIFLALYIAIMLLCGYIGMCRTKNSDDYATARASYGPLTIALCMTATVASGATFLGTPGWAYQYGVSTFWYSTLYPVAVYAGVLLCMMMLRRCGDLFASRSIPEFLGARYQSTPLRVGMSLFSLMLLFYVAGQFVAGAVVFMQLLGLPPLGSMLLTTLVLGLYIGFGGSHADILTDSVQGAVMVAISLGVLCMCLIGLGVEGGMAGVWERLEASDPKLVMMFNPQHPVAASWWGVFCIIVAHVPFGLLPHQGARLWALKDDRSRYQFITLAAILGLLLPLIAAGGLLARAVLGDALLTGGHTPNEAIPAVLIEVLPPWLAALLAAGILAAIMSTADGLIISCSQVFANDLFRCTIAPRYCRHLSAERLDHIVLRISRWTAVLVLLAALLLGWSLLDVNVTRVIWIGLGGMMAALAGPLILGVLLRSVTRTGAELGALTGVVVFIVLKLDVIEGDWLAGTAWEGVIQWVAAQARNPFACATLGVLGSLGVTWFASLVSSPLPESHLNQIFPPTAAPVARPPRRLHRIPPPVEETA